MKIIKGFVLPQEYHISFTTFDKQSVEFIEESISMLLAQLEEDGLITGVKVE